MKDIPAAFIMLVFVVICCYNFPTCKDWDGPNVKIGEILMSGCK